MRVLQHQSTAGTGPPATEYRPITSRYMWSWVPAYRAGVRRQTARQRGTRPPNGLGRPAGNLRGDRSWPRAARRDTEDE